MRPECPVQRAGAAGSRPDSAGMSLSVSQAGATCGNRRLRCFLIGFLTWAHEMMAEPETLDTFIVYDVCSPSFQERRNPKTVKMGWRAVEGGCTPFPHEMDGNGRSCTVHAPERLGLSVRFCFGSETGGIAVFVLHCPPTSAPFLLGTGQSPSRSAFSLKPAVSPSLVVETLL